MKAYDLIKASEKYLKNLGYKFEATGSYDIDEQTFTIEETKEKNINYNESVYYPVSLLGYLNYNSDVRVYANIHSLDMSYFNNRKGKYTNIEETTNEWQKFLLNELGQEFVDEMKKYLNHLENQAKKRYNNSIKIAQANLNNELNEIENKKINLNIKEENSL